MGKKGKAKGGVNPRSLRPPTIQTRPVQRMKMRWYGNSGSVASGAVTKGSMLTWLLAVATETTSAQATCLFGAVRLRRVSMWSTGVTAATTGQSQVQLNWAGSVYSTDREIVAYGNQVYPAYLTTTPPKNSLIADSWVSQMQSGFANTSVVFYFSTNAAGLVIDIDFDYVLNDVSSSSAEGATEVTLSAATASGIYCAYLEGGTGGVSSMSAYGFTPVGIASVPLRSSKLLLCKDSEGVSAPDEPEQILLEAKRLLEKLTLK